MLNICLNRSDKIPQRNNNEKTSTYKGDGIKHLLGAFMEGIRK